MSNSDSSISLNRNMTLGSNQNDKVSEATRNWDQEIQITVSNICYIKIFEIKNNTLSFILLLKQQI